MATILPGVEMTTTPKGLEVRSLSVAAQTVAAATLTQITGSLLRVPQGGLKVGTRIRWVFNMTKTAAGTAASTIAITFGTLGTSADTARVSFTKIAGTAVADEARVEITAVVRSVSATGVVVGNFTLSHNLDATGHATTANINLKTTSSGFDNRGEELYVALVITTGAADAITIDWCEAELNQTK
jgi:hypothetical protein